MITHSTGEKGEDVRYAAVPLHRLLIFCEFEFDHVTLKAKLLCNQFLNNSYSNILIFTRQYFHIPYYSVSQKECNKSLKVCFLKAVSTTSKFIAHADDVTSQLCMKISGMH